MCTACRLLQRVLLLLVVPLLGIPIAQAQSADDGREHSITMVDTLVLAEGEILYVENYKGSITVTTWDRPDVAYSARIVAEDIDGQMMLPEIEIQIDRDQEGELGILTNYRKALRAMQQIYPDLQQYSLPPVHYVISMPRATQLKIDDYMSEIDIAGLGSDLEIYTYKGHVAVSNLDGAIKLDMFMGKADIGFSNLARDSIIDTYESNVDVRLPQNAAFNLALDLGALSTLMDFGFSLTETGKDPPKLNAINGGGPQLQLTNHSGFLRLYAQ